MNPQQFSTFNPQQQAQAQQFYTRTGSHNFGGPAQFATAPGGSMLMAPQQAAAMAMAVHTWVPQNPLEQQYYDMLFVMADEEKRGAIGGRLAVAFFSRSKLDKLVLREVGALLLDGGRKECMNSAPSVDCADLEHRRLPAAQRAVQERVLRGDAPD